MKYIMLSDRWYWKYMLNMDIVTDGKCTNCNRSCFYPYLYWNDLNDITPTNTRITCFVCKYITPERKAEVFKQARLLIKLDNI